MVVEFSDVDVYKLKILLATGQAFARYHAYVIVIKFTIYDLVMRTEK
jgi:hypothetical protein